MRGSMSGRLLSVNVGMPKEVRWQGKTVFTGVSKNPVSGPRRVRTLNVDGDGQGDLAGHGGEQRAVFVYQIDSYRHWEQELGRIRRCWSPTAAPASTSACSRRARCRPVTRSSRSPPDRNR